MNIQRKLKKIGRDLQEVAMEMGAKATKFIVARSPKQYRKGSYIRIYDSEGSHLDKRNNKFHIGRITDKPRPRDSWATDIDGNVEEVWEVDVEYEDMNGRFWETTIDWDDYAGNWSIIDRQYHNEIKRKVSDPKNWNPPIIK